MSGFAVAEPDRATSEEAGQLKSTTFVGLDVHKETIAAAVARAGRGEAESLGIYSNTPEAVRKLLRKLGPRNELLVCYEAGPCGYALHRQLKREGIKCLVVAPSLVPKKPGDRVKTDRRDARNLARLLRSGDLTPVWVPSEEHEALRDLVRARGDVREDLQRKRHQLGKFLLRHEIRPPIGMRAWTKRHREWLAGLKPDQAAHRVVLAEYLHAIEVVESSLERLEQEIAAMSETGELAATVSGLQTLRGVALVTAATLVAEIGDITRFQSPRQLMSYSGLVPSEHSSGGSQRRGSITKAGNSHIRHVVVEAAWHYRHTPRVGEVLRKRSKGQPEKLREISWRAQSRLNRKYRRMTARGKAKQVAVVAVARELLGFVWAVAKETQSCAKRLAAD